VSEEETSVPFFKYVTTFSAKQSQMINDKNLSNMYVKYLQ